MDYIIQRYSDSLEFERYTIENILTKAPYKYSALVKSASYAELTAELVQDTIPIGTLEYVRKALLLQGYSENVLSPIEIPHFLQKPMYLKRKYKIDSYKYLPKNGLWFIKDATALKSSCARVIPAKDIPDWVEEYTTIEEAQTHKFVVSEPVQIDAEYRVLVCRGVVQGVQYYNGDPLLFPDANLIKNAVYAMSTRLQLGRKVPKSYTIDVGVNKEIGTFLIEIHNFVACGTYNFESNSLPQMYIDGIEYERECSKEKDFKPLYYPG